MKQNRLLLLLPLLLATTVSAQESNLKEDYSAYLPEIRAFNKSLAQMPAGKSILTKEGLDETRKFGKMIANTKTILQPTIKTIKGPFGDINLSIFKPDTIRAVVLDIHGGSWIAGGPENDAELNDAMARACHVAVVSVDYHLSPEFPFPACIEDCKAAAKWLVTNAKKEFGTDKLFVSGGSAGGHLAAVTTLYIRDSLKAIDKVKGVNLVYGAFDLGRTPSLRSATDSTLILFKENVEDIMKLVFPGWSTEKKQDPKYSPLYADLKGLPPALFTVGTADPLLDDSFFMETRWRNAGNKTFLAVYPECPHAFNVFPTKIAKLANERMMKWMNGLLGAD
jgi:acetyl esterase/lipase